jgi:arylsulfatase A-like enzyme
LKRLAALWAFLWCAATPMASTAAAADGPPNLVLVSLDALRADALSCYGNTRPASPFLDELAASGVRFANAQVSTHGTPTSHTTMLSGLYQETHRVSYAVADAPAGASPPPELISEKVTLISQILKSRGWRTLAVTDGGHVAAALGFSRGFDVYDDQAGGVKPGTERMLKLVAASTARPLFLFLHTYQVHSPYMPPAPYKGMFGTFDSTFEPTNENLVPLAFSAKTVLKPADLALCRARYDEGLRYTDDVLRRFFAKLKDVGVLDNALVIVTSDHGEEFGEHGGLIHRDLLYQELLHVPLIAVGTGAVRLGPPRVETALVGEVSIAPTILTLAGVAPPASMEGPVILPKVNGSKMGPIYAQYGGRRYSIRDGDLKLIETVKPFKVELYDLSSDPAETKDLFDERGTDARRLYRALAKWRSQRKPVTGEAVPAPLDKEQLERLRSLGYLTGR